MTGVVESEQDGTGGEPNINVKSLRMRFEKSDDTQEGAMTDKCRDVKVASKASESIKKFESLVKQEPGFKPSDLGRSLSKSMSAKGSIRVGSLRHKFESLANRSLTADLFNTPGESGDDQEQDLPSNIVPLQDNPETSSTRGSDNNAEGKLSAAECGSEILSDTIAMEASEHVAHISSEGEVIAEEVSTYTVDTEDSIEEPGLCLKEQIERAQADEKRSAAQGSPSLQDAVEQDSAVSTEISRNGTAELDNTAGRPAPDNDFSSQKREITDNPDGTFIVSSDACADNLPTVSPATNESPVNASVLPVSEEHIDADDMPQAQVNLEKEASDRPEDPVELNAEHEQAPVEIERCQDDTPKSRGFFQRLFTCGASV